MKKFWLDNIRNRLRTVKVETLSAMISLRGKASTKENSEVNEKRKKYLNRYTMKLNERRYFFIYMPFVFYTEKKETKHTVFNKNFQCFSRCTFSCYVDRKESVVTLYAWLRAIFKL